MIYLQILGAFSGHVCSAFGVCVSTGVFTAVTATHSLSPVCGQLCALETNQVANSSPGCMLKRNAHIPGRKEKHTYFKTITKTPTGFHGAAVGRTWSAHSCM